MPSSHRNADSLEEALGHTFRDPELLRLALTHASYAREAESQATGTDYADNESMEFLGDAVLSFVVSQELFRRFPEYHEGELSKLRAHIVSARRLLRPAHQLCIGEHLRLGRGEERSGGRSKSTLLVDTLEAIIAALYLDGGLEVAHAFILEYILLPELAEVESYGKQLPVMDYKSALQEALHAGGRAPARYLMVKEEGPDHRKMFTVEAHIAASPAGDAAFTCRSEGSTKKSAEQGAARLAWERLQSLQERSAVVTPAAEAAQNEES